MAIASPDAAQRFLHAFHDYAEASAVAGYAAAGAQPLRRRSASNERDGGSPLRAALSSVLADALLIVEEMVLDFDNEDPASDDESKE